MTYREVLGLVYLSSLLLVVGVGAQESPVKVEPESPVQSKPAAVATVLRLIKFSGLVNGAFGQPPTGVVGITFALYAGQEGGSPLWLETQNVELDERGRYTVLLGATQSEGLPLELFTSGEARWLGIQVQGQPEQPRVLLVAVPYALRAEEAQRLAGREASEFLLAEEMESEVRQVVETSVVEEMEAQGLTTTEEGTTKTITDGASTFTDSNASQVVLVDQNGSGFGLRALAGSNPAVRGLDEATSGTNSGVQGQTNSTSGRGVRGLAAATTGSNIGVLGEAFGSSGRGVVGLARANSGSTIGVQGQAFSPDGIGFSALSQSTVGPTRGLIALVKSSQGIAGLFDNTAGGTILSARTNGTEVFSVDGNGSIESDGTGSFSGDTSDQILHVVQNGPGILDPSPTNLPPAAVRGEATASTNSTLGVLGVAASPDGLGVVGLTSATSGEAIGVLGLTSSTSGVAVEADSLATSGSTFGLFAQDASTGGTAIRGESTAVSGNTRGVVGEVISPDGTGGIFFAPLNGTILEARRGEAGPTIFRVDGDGSVNITGSLDVTGAGSYGGDLHVNGTLSKMNGSFKIDHPLDPANKYLYHSFVESPDMMNIYNGVVALDENGEAFVELPEWFEALNRDFRYQLTAMGTPGPNLYIAEKIRGNRFKIAGGQRGMEVSWQVSGVRQDAFARNHRIQVEVSKPKHERGYYLYPEGFGQPPEKGIQWADRDVQKEGKNSLSGGR